MKETFNSLSEADDYLNNKGFSYVFEYVAEANEPPGMIRCYRNPETSQTASIFYRFKLNKIDGYINQPRLMTNNNGK